MTADVDVDVEVVPDQHDGSVESLVRGVDQADVVVQRWQRVLGDVEERLVVCGHTHMPFDRLIDQRRVVNPGSVGMAYGPPGAYWAILGPAIELRRTTYDARAAAERIAASGYPDAAAWAEEYVLRPYSDVAALEGFTAIVAAETPTP